LLTRMMAAGLTHGKRVLLIDKSSKKTNDRTWCFWEDTPGFFEPLVYKKWSQLWFHATSFSNLYNIAPYQYKMIRGIDFYDDCFERIKNDAAIEIINGAVTQRSFSGNSLRITIDDRAYEFRGTIVFNSLYDEAAARQQNTAYLLQHFRGWEIETAHAVFNPDEAILMDFRVSQANGTTFVYVLPRSATSALIEYTLFSEKILPEHVYNNGLKTYLQDHLQPGDYTITAVESGVIPMTDAKFPWYANGMYHIGTAGGQTKASSGYTFPFIQKQSAAIVEQLQLGSFGPRLIPVVSPKRFSFYDAVLLRVLANKYASGSDVFCSLFKNNKPSSIFSFLDNTSSLKQDIGIIQSLPTRPFLKAALRQLF